MSYKTCATDLSKQLKSDDLIPNHRSIVRSFDGDHTLAALFEQLIFWQKHSSDHKEGWFYKSQDELTDELCISASQQRRLFGILLDLDLIERERRPAKGKGGNFWHFRLKMEACKRWINDALETTVSSYSSNFKLRNPYVRKYGKRSLEDEVSEGSYIEVVQETTQENTTRECGSEASPAETAPPPPDSETPPNPTGPPEEVPFAPARWKPGDAYPSSVAANKRLWPLFCHFWRNYPKKESPHVAWAEFQALKPTPEGVEAMIRDVRRRVKEGDWTDKRFIIWPERYLKRRLFDGGEVEDETEGPPGRAAPTLTPEERERLDRQKAEEIKRKLSTGEIRFAVG